MRSRTICVCKWRWCVNAPYDFLSLRSTGWFNSESYRLRLTRAGWRCRGGRSYKVDAPHLSTSAGDVLPSNPGDDVDEKQPRSKLHHLVIHITKCMKTDSSHNAAHLPALPETTMVSWQLGVQLRAHHA